MFRLHSLKKLPPKMWNKDHRKKQEKMKNGVVNSVVANKEGDERVMVKEVEKAKARQSKAKEQYGY